MRHYEDRNTQYQQNRLFETNQRRLFEEIEGLLRESKEIMTSYLIKRKAIWNGIWGKSVKHNCMGG